MSLKYKYRILTNILFIMVGIGGYFFMQEMWLYAVITFIVTGVYGNWLSYVIMKDLKKRFGFLFNKDNTLGELDKVIDDD